ncbi:NAD-dependent succinate-semialdehyde dehydrogenase [Mycolicibacterium diernhoferi]|uniref:Succinate-semialdehyde dehydrogenase n=1 Tax=Mycolicibacterium diernhoferi TaxID=1801 RepID=A0A1Q4H5N3_9MYCO|nr:NAD-dependent succinate-semialdehyde dehydrogenase [Mycolicibacterium diernhoferi]OJZ62874.1 succinate-semialdehyde dehydrogenase [Mycolicibacterium diernhoferi]OPE55069.1 succinate-semialdehyde dehydrogenase [Mycolicibacterium diernhoferi]PEG54690.1 succinate-semialdehyde dehydrogenase [Mycolicibacterium diernhoferi]QYL22909.1 NAD-dependent succinate-semialdehyde dehydrogenase [Mycolicibacterium diernhoferi]
MTTYAVTNPATGETLKGFPGITDEDLATAIGQAASAQAAWSASSIAERVEVLRKVAAIYDERAEELGAIISREMGKPIGSAIGEAQFSASIYRYYADSAEEFLADEPIKLRGGSGTGVIRRAPLGVVLGIMPWNYPYFMAARCAAPNLMIGNTVLLKPAPQCPESAAAIEAVFNDAGLPSGAYTTILASNEQIESVIADPRVRGVSLTGSGRAGSAVAKLAGEHLKKVVLELGGSDPFLVLSTDDMDSLVTKAVAARMYNSGQACNAAKRFIVADHLYDEFLEKFVAGMSTFTPGDPFDPATKLGPLCSVEAAERLEAQVNRAVQEGAKVELGGQRDGAFFPPTVLTNVRRDGSAYAEEFFGPVAQVFRARDEAEAVELANDTEFGLGSFVFTDDPVQAERVADQIQAGMVYINTVEGEGPEVPFGGVKNSGYGRELGRLGAEEFVNMKLVRTGA